MKDYMTPEEERRTAAADAHIHTALGQAHKDLVSLNAAMQAGESREVVAMWVDRVYGGLRGLGYEDLLRAVILALRDNAYGDACALWRAVAS